jgi:separase
VQTYVTAYNFLAQAVTLLDFDDVAERASDSEQEVRANFVRCTSANFHNLASLLCQGELYGHAVRFLMQGCDLGERALRMHCRQGPANQEEAWVILAQQLYRRWELLGACYSKVGDRKVRCV